MAAPSIAERAAFDFVRYASVWEDADVLCEALAPVARDERILSIASAGDNALALLTIDPEAVIAVDLSPAQLACVDLRVAAFRMLAHGDLLRFLGVTPGDDRPRVYRGMRAALSEGTRRFWDDRPSHVARGIIHAGKFERYFATFRTWALPILHSRKVVEELTRLSDPEAQRAFYERRWNTARWRFLFRLFFSRAVMGRYGRDPEFFAQVEGPVGERLFARARQALTEIPVTSNPFLIYILTGNFRPEALPRYLRPEHHETIRSRLDRLRIRRGSVEEVREEGLKGLNLSDVFEYMPLEEAKRCYRALLDKVSRGARLVYWNMLVPRPGAEWFPDRVRRLTGLADDLHRRDRAWFYTGFHIDEVISAEFPR